MMVAGRVVLGREAGVAGRVSVAASVYEHVFLLGLSAIVSVGLLLHVGDLGQGPWLWIVAAVPFALVLLHPRVFAPVSARLLRRFGRRAAAAFLSGRDVAFFIVLYSVCVRAAGHRRVGHRPRADGRRGGPATGSARGSCCRSSCRCSPSCFRVRAWASARECSR